MKQETIGAIVGAVTKWDLMAQGITRGDDADCPLCTMFNSNSVNSSYRPCSSCPVLDNNGGITLCRSTPFTQTMLASNLTIQEDIKECPDSPPNLDAVEEEIEFLISLLPEGSKEAKSYIL